MNNVSNLEELQKLIPQLNDGKNFINNVEFYKNTSIKTNHCQGADERLQIVKLIFEDGVVVELTNYFDYNGYLIDNKEEIFKRFKINFKKDLSPENLNGQLSDYGINWIIKLK